uniref:Uncharacterized protein n=1 Tax=Panagrolaimus sp. ES5 TaxID=591445 RepID=A0AC34FMH9_9BILA
MLSFSKLLLQKSKPFRSSSPQLKSNVYSTQHGFTKVAILLIFSITMGTRVGAYGANALESYEVYVAASKED